MKEEYTGFVVYKGRQILCQAVSVFSFFVVLRRVNFTIFLVGVMWYGMYKGGESLVTSNGS